VGTVLGAMSLSLLGIVGTAAAADCQPVVGVESTFCYTGAEQTYVVPPGVTNVRVVAVGGHGGLSGGSVVAVGGFGALVSADLPVTPGEVLYVTVGANNGGFGGGGESCCEGGSGGGGSDVRLGGAGVERRVLVAGGGGGGGAPGDDLRGGSHPGGGAGGNAGISADGRGHDGDQGHSVPDLPGAIGGGGGGGGSLAGPGDGGDSGDPQNRERGFPGGFGPGGRAVGAGGGGGGYLGGGAGGIGGHNSVNPSLGKGAYGGGGAGSSYVTPYGTSEHIQTDSTGVPMVKIGALVSDTAAGRIEAASLTPRHFCTKPTAASDHPDAQIQFTLSEPEQVVVVITGRHQRTVLRERVLHAVAGRVSFMISVKGLKQGRYVMTLTAIRHGKGTKPVKLHFRVTKCGAPPSSGFG
jgi:hypothetical protein